MNEKIKNLSDSEIQTLIEYCITMTTVIPEGNTNGVPKFQLGRETIIKISEWLTDKKFIE